MKKTRGPGRPKGIRTEILYVYVTPKIKNHVKSMSKVFGSESIYVDSLIQRDIERIKNEIS